MSLQYKPKVSVVMGVYNSADLIEGTIESVLSQQGVELEFVIVDDGSGAKTQEVLREIPDSRIKLIRQENQGLTKSLIVACKQSTGDYIARIDVGDQMLPNRLCEQAQMLTDDSTIALVCSPVTLVTNEGFPLLEVSYSRQSLHKGLTQPNSPNGDSPFHASVMFRRDLYQNVGGYRPEFYLAQDLDLWSRLVELGKVAVTAKPLTTGVFLPTGLSALHAQKQAQLKSIVSELIALRARNEDESDLLRRAELIRPDADDSNSEDSFSGNYFIGRCLLKNGHYGAKIYLFRALKARVWSAKTYWSLFQSLFYRQAK